MNLILHLPDHLEAAIKREAEKSGVDMEAFVLEVVRSKIEPKQPSVRRSQEEFLAKFHKALGSLPAVSSFVDDSRESIYTREDDWNKTSQE